MARKTIPKPLMARRGKGHGSVPRFVPTLQIFDGFDQADRADLAYWRSKSAAYRMRALERLRERNYGYGEGKPLPRFQRIFKVVELGEG